MTSTCSSASFFVLFFLARFIPPQTSGAVLPKCLGSASWRERRRPMCFRGSLVGDAEKDLNRVSAVAQASKPADPAVLVGGSIFQGGRGIWLDVHCKALIAFVFRSLAFAPPKNRADRESRRLFDSLFAGLSLSEGKSLSKAERRRKGLMNDRALIYGEASAEGRVGHLPGYFVESSITYVLLFRRIAFGCPSTVETQLVTDRRVHLFL